MSTHCMICKASTPIGDVAYLMIIIIIVIIITIKVIINNSAFQLMMS